MFLYQPYRVRGDTAEAICLIACNELSDLPGGMREVG